MYVHNERCDVQYVNKRRTKVEEKRIDDKKKVTRPAPDQIGAALISGELIGFEEKRVDQLHQIDHFLKKNFFFGPAIYSPPLFTLQPLQHNI